MIKMINFLKFTVFEPFHKTHLYKIIIIIKRYPEIKYALALVEHIANVYSISGYLFDVQMGHPIHYI